MKAFVPLSTNPRMHRGTAYYSAKPPRGVRACFKHRVAQHVCHCQSPDQVDVTYKIALPKKKDLKGWERLRVYLAGLARQALNWETYYLLEKTLPADQARAMYYDLVNNRIGRKFEGYKFGVY